MYPNAMSGTRMLLILAMRCIPPKMMIRVSSVIAEPMYNGRIWKALSNAAQIVLLCTELKAKPNVMVISTANRIPIHRFFSPVSI